LSASETPLYEETLPETFFKVPGVLRETEAAFFCDFEIETEEKKKKTKGKSKRIVSRMPKMLCGRTITREEYKAFVTLGATPPIVDFVSKKGRNFAASLHLKPNGSFEFKFAPRTPKPKSETSPSKTKRTKAKVVKKTADSSKIAP
jgi:DNA topoisomerase III